MAPNKGKAHLDEATKFQILELHTQRLSARAIGRQLGYSNKAISNFLKFWKDENKVHKEETRGNFFFLSENDRRQIILNVKRNRFITVKKLRLEMPHLNASITTFGRAIKSSGEFNSYWAARKPFISQVNRIKRYRWAKMHAKWTKEVWRRVVYTDESPFCLR